VHPHDVARGKNTRNTDHTDLMTKKKKKKTREEAGNA